VFRVYDHAQIQPLWQSRRISLRNAEKDVFFCDLGENLYGLAVKVPAGLSPTASVDSALLLRDFRKALFYTAWRIPQRRV